MKVGIGLPATVPGVDKTALVGFAQRAEQRGFSSLGTIDRLVFANYESLIALAAAAAVTERIRLLTDILIVPYRANAALLAKQAATLDSLSGGRLTLAVAVGGRDDDYRASGVPFETRGKRMDAMLREMKDVWAGADRGFAGPIGPPTPQRGGPELLIGGTVGATWRRVREFGDGWTMGGGTPDDFAAGAEKARSAWREAGREGAPRLIALCYFALGDTARDDAESYLHSYYRIVGEDVAGMIAKSAAVTPEMAARYRDGFADVGADELVFFPCSTDVKQVDLLADAVL
jgi:alkanesulfonate monooxygenase SsuD/methylene tetrahydromethanopterin reductase-like flavin-dependent oxidoreductase (luciferase family)